MIFPRLSTSGRGGRGRSHSPRPRSPSRGKSPNKSRTPSPKGVCYDFLKGTCKRGKNCPFLHKKRSLSPRGDKPKKKINATCKFWKEGNCSRGDKCRFQHKDIEKPSTPAPKSEAAPAAPKSVQLLGLILPHPAAEEEALGRSRRTRQASQLRAPSPLDCN